MSKVYPSLTRLQPGDTYTHDTWGEVTVVSVKRARNNRGIQPYDVVKVSHSGGTIIIPTFTRPEGVNS